MSNKRTSPWFGYIMKIAVVITVCLASAIIGGSLPRLAHAGDYSLTYADFVSIMLTAISVLMTVLAIFLAVAGFVGWTTIEQKVHGKTEEYLAQGLETGGKLERMIEDMLEKKTEQMMYRGVEPVARDDTKGDKALTSDRDGAV